MNNEQLAEELVKLAEEVVSLSEFKSNKTATMTQEIKEMCESFIDQTAELVESKCQAKAEKLFGQEKVKADVSGAQEIYDYLIKQVKKSIL